MKTFILMGALSAVAAVIVTARLNAATSALGTGIELQVIAAAVIGGTSFAGGIGTIAGGVLGAVIIQSLSSGMALIGITTPGRTSSSASCWSSRSASTHGFGADGEREGHVMTATGTTSPVTDRPPPPLVEMRNIRVSFGGVHAVDG